MKNIFLRNLRIILFFAFILCGSVLVTQNSFAANPFYNGTTLFVYGTSSPNDFTHQAIFNSYIPLGGYNASQVVYNDVSRMSADQVRSLVSQNIANNPSSAYSTFTVGHGDASSASSTYLTGPLNRNGWGNAINNGYAQNGTHGNWFDDSCGSGACGNLWKPDASSAIDGVFTSTRPGVVGNDTNHLNRLDPNFNSGWQSDYGDSIRRMLNDAGHGGANDPDKNGDGVLTNKEVGEYLNKINPGTYKIKPGSDDNPMFFKDKATAEKYGKFTECIILRPGQVDSSYSPTASSVNGVSVEYKLSSIGGYENRTKDPIAFPVLGQIQDSDISHESQINFDLRKLGSDFIEKHVAQALSKTSTNTGIKKRIVLLPTRAQAQEFVNSLGGNSGAEGKYMLSNIEVEVGRHYLAKHPSPQDKIVFDDECVPLEWTQPTPAPSPQVALDGNGGNPGNNNGGINAPTASNGLDGVLQSLLGSLLGRQPQQNNNQNQNNSTQTQSCAQYGISPVCGSNGVTYNNFCWVPYGVQQVHAGLCVQATSVSSQNIGGVISQLVNSGISTAMQNALIGIITTIFSQANIGQTVVQ